MTALRTAQTENSTLLIVFCSSIGTKLTSKHLWELSLAILLALEDSWTRFMSMSYHVIL